MKYRARCAAILLSLASIAVGRAEPLEPGVVHIIDGDTIRVHSSTVRLVGFDAPETGERACVYRKSDSAILVVKAAKDWL
jgi:endonuclease YncB( thermonuclease family)